MPLGQYFQSAAWRSNITGHLKAQPPLFWNVRRDEAVAPRPAGSALGGLARFWVGLWCVALLGPDFPWGTLAINMVGSFVIGLAATALPVTAGDARAFLMVGFCGGFTTFSSYSLQSWSCCRPDAGRRRWLTWPARSSSV